MGVAMTSDRTRSEARLTLKGELMNQNEISGKWNQLKGKVQQQWGKLTHDDLDRIDGKKDELVGRIQERYGKTRSDADREVNQFFNSLA